MKDDRIKEIALEYASIVVKKHFHMIHNDFEAVIKLALREERERSDKIAAEDTELIHTYIQENKRLQKQLDKYRDVLDALKGIDNSDCIDDVFETITCAIEDLTPPEETNEQK